ncbi:MAG: hypothetical protein ACM3PE_09760 [Deltaproteobacteria bacterium]
MAANKHLGKGLDLLLSATAQPLLKRDEEIDILRVERIYSEALKADEEGNLYEAYYQYRNLIDYLETRLALHNKAVCLLASQAFNNAAIILYEAGRGQEATVYLRRACDICPDNEVARENLELISQ